MLQSQYFITCAVLSGALLLSGCSSNHPTTATAPVSSPPAVVQSSSEVEPMINQQVQPAQPLQQDAPNFNVDVEVSESNSASSIDVTPQNNALQDQRADEMNRQEEFARNRAAQQQDARQQAERQDAAQGAIWERVDRNEAQRRESEAAAVRQLDENRRNREMEASQRSIERQETEKRDIARSGRGDAFDRFRMDTRDNRIENERQRMSENQ